MGEKPNPASGFTPRELTHDPAPASRPAWEGEGPSRAALPFGRPIRRRYGRRLLGVAVLALAGLWFGLQRHVSYYSVTSKSMEPTLQVGERVAADNSHTPRVGDIVVFHPPAGAVPADPVCGTTSQGAGFAQACGFPVPQESSATFIKRVVAGPGDLISIVDGHAVLNGASEREPYIEPCDHTTACSFPAPVRVPAGDYYVLGDNRGVSDDSRFWGPVPSAWIIGKVVRCSFLETLCHSVR